MTRNQFYAICNEATVNPFLALEDEAVKNILREAKATNEDEKNIEKLKKYLQENYWWRPARYPGRFIAARRLSSVYMAQANNATTRETSLWLTNKKLTYS